VQPSAVAGSRYVGLSKQAFHVDRQRFGLKTHKETDDRDIFYDYLTLLRIHKFDFHSSLRLLTTFSPSKAGSPKYTRPFASNMVAECTTDMRAESVDKAIDEVEGWLSVYANRVNDEEEISAWKKTGSDWEGERKKAMEGANPRFVLRQWVLEELISELEETGVKGIKEGRRKLARVLDVSCPSAPKGRKETDRRCQQTRSGRTKMMGRKRVASEAGCVGSEGRICWVSSAAVLVRKDSSRCIFIRSRPGGPCCSTERCTPLPLW